MLVLQGGREASTLFRIVDAKTLRKLDLEGRDIESALNYALTRTATFERHGAEADDARDVPLHG